MEMCSSHSRVPTRVIYCVTVTATALEKKKHFHLVEQNNFCDVICHHSVYCGTILLGNPSLALANWWIFNFQWQLATGVMTVS